MKILSPLILEKVLKYSSQKPYYSTEKIDFYAFDTLGLLLTKGEIGIWDFAEVVKASGDYYRDMLKKDKSYAKKRINLIAILRKKGLNSKLGRKAISIDDIGVIPKVPTGVPLKNRGYTVVITDVYWIKFMTEFFRKFIYPTKNLKTFELGKEDLESLIRKGFNLINEYLRNTTR